MQEATRLALVSLGTVAVLGGLGYAGYRYFSRGPAGRVICPLELGHRPANTTTVVPGDAVIVTLGAADGARETTWASVLETRKSKLRVELIGENAQGGRKPLDPKHGFALGDKLTIGRDCVLDVYHPPKLNGRILCGPDLALLDDVVSPPFRTSAGSNDVGRDEHVQIVVAAYDGKQWYEPLWVTVNAISPTGQVLSGKVDTVPKLAQHGLGEGSSVSFNRDCIVAIA